MTYLGPGETHLGYRETATDVARVLGHMSDGIEYRVTGAIPGMGVRICAPPELQPTAATLGEPC